jgi:CheY-like chemotaxis protein
MDLLVVANQTLAGRAVYDEVRRMLRVEPYLKGIYIVVPATVVDGSDEASGRADATLRLDAALSNFAALGISAQGEVGHRDPLRAVQEVLRRQDWVKILLVTLPAARSAWLRMDLPHRMQRSVGKAVVIPIESEIEPMGIDIEPVLWHGLHNPHSHQPSIDVLLVEDNEADAELTRIAIERAAVEVNLVIAGNGREALEHVGRHKPDLILLDLKMPVMGGLEALEQLRDVLPISEVPVIVLTTSARDADRERAHELGAWAYVVKEASFDRFADVIDGLLREVSARRP